MAVTLNPTQPLQVQPITKLTDEPLFELTFKHGYMKEDIFFQAKNMETAIKLGEKYCRTKRLRFITVTPMIQDINALIEKAEENL